MKDEKSSKHKQFVQAVERSLRQVARHMLQGALLEGCLKMWRDFAARVDITKTRKPEVWAAAVAYTFERVQLSGFSQTEIARAFKVSPITVSQKYRQITQTLNLVVLDARYLPEARRAVIQREQGPWPHDLPLLEAPIGWWGLPPRPPIESVADLESWLEERQRGPLRRAQDLVYDGWEALDALTGPGDPQEAERCFHEALRLDPTLADAHNGLADVAEERGDWETAEAHYRRAYELARDALGSESPRAFHWWLELETRPYMRARQGLGWVYWQTGRYREALGEYEALLRLNKNDNQGARYVIGPLYQLAGDLEGALRAYERFVKHYPDDIGDPHHAFCWGLSLYEAGRKPEAVSRWRQALFQNIYIALLLLGERLPEEAIWVGSNLGWPDYAEDYLDLYGALWERVSGARGCLRRLWLDPEMRADVRRWLELGQQLEALAESARNRAPGAEMEWQRLIEQQWAIEERAPSAEMVARVVGA
jgi:tetratricopeptide (TPR) repeat protein